MRSTARLVAVGPLGGRCMLLPWKCMQLMCLPRDRNLHKPSLMDVDFLFEPYARMEINVCHGISYRPLACEPMSCQAILLAVPCHATLRYATPRYATLATLRYATLRYLIPILMLMLMPMLMPMPMLTLMLMLMLCYATLCYVVLY